MSLVKSMNIPTTLVRTDKTNDTFQVKINIYFIIPFSYLPKSFFRLPPITATALM